MSTTPKKGEKRKQVKTLVEKMTHSSVCTLLGTKGSANIYLIVK
jgi:hypothetical protein